ncbi:MAG: translocation/assembly module TamB [Bacteroidales bacterium]|nr:translocation/assembly module TamB [Bacteroidales bacterium]
MLVRNPFTQTLLARITTSYLKKELNTEIKIDRLEIRSFKSLLLKNLMIQDQQNDTLLYTKRFSIKFFNYNFRNTDFDIDKIELENAVIRFRKYKGNDDINFKFIVDYLIRDKSPDDKTYIDDSSSDKKKSLYLVLKDLTLSDTRFIFENQNIDIDRDGVNFMDIDLHIEQLVAGNAVIEDNHLNVDIHHLSFYEKSGFLVNSLSCNFKIGPQILQAQNLLLLTPENDIDLDLKFSFNSFKEYKYFLQQVRIESVIRPSTINLTEIGYFAPVMYAMDNRIKISGEISGTVDNFKARNFKFAFGDNTQFRGNVQMNGIPDINETFSHLSISNFTTGIGDIKAFNLPVVQNIDLPSLFTPLGQIKIKGKFTGFYNDFVSYADFKTDIGHINTDMLLRVNDLNTTEYKGKIAANDFNFGKFMNVEEYVKRLDVTADITGTGLTFEKMDIQMDGIIDSLEFFDNIYNEIVIAGNLNDQKFIGNVNVNDDYGQLDFNGIIDYSSNIPSYNFIAKIKDAKLQKINIANRDSSMNLSTIMDINIIGDNLDEMQGIINIDSTVYTEKGEKYTMNDFYLSITRDAYDFSLVRLFSDIVDASIEGKFKMMELPHHFNNFVNQYLDTLIMDVSIVDSLLNIQDFVFDIELKNTAPVTQLFLPELALSDGAILSGGFSSRVNNLFLDGYAEEIEYHGRKFKNCFIDLDIENGEIILSNSIEKFIFTDSIYFDSLNTKFKARNDSIQFAIDWDNKNKSTRNFGEIEGHLAIYNKKKMAIKFVKGEIAINDTLWRMSPENSIHIDTNSFQFDNVAFQSIDQGLMVNGNISHNINDTLQIGFDNFNLSNFDQITKRSNIDLDGIIDGNAKIIDFYSSPALLSNLFISDLYFNKEELGEAKIISTWDPVNEAFDVLAEIIYSGNIGKSKTLQVAGTYFPKREEDNFDIDIKLNNYKLVTLQPFVKSFSSKLSGLATGEVALSGSNIEPNIIGEINLMRTEMHIDYLNVSYSFADKIYFDKNIIYFDDIIIYDSLNNQATATGSLYHNHFKDLSFDLKFNANKIAGLNTIRSQNKAFYGKAFGTGDIHIYGPPDELILDIAAKTEKGTNVFIPVSYGTEVISNDYIIFVNNEEDTAITKPDYDVNSKGLSLKMDLDVTTDADIQIFLPYQMGNIRGNGSGNIIMGITPANELTMDGEYIINRGNLFLTLQSILNRNFDIRRGSKLEWDGDPYNAQIDLIAVYKIKTTLGEYGPAQDSATRIPVDCVMALSNKLSDPEIRFTIEFPGLSDESKQYIYSRLDTNDQAMMSQQVISLMVLNSFSYSSGSSGSVGFNTFSLITNQINNWLSQISNDFDIGINYRPGDQLTANEVEVALSTQLFDERVMIDGNVGVRGSESAQNTNDFVGEVTVEVKITRDGRFRAKAFNRSNNDYLYRSYAPYTQGVGVFYTQEFSKISDLFQRKKRKEKK